MTATIITGDCLQMMRELPANSVDAVVTDPPYGLTSARPSGRSEATRGAVMGGFMGLKWDSGVPSVEVWAECLRVLKPGGHLLSFGGTRTYHRLVVAIEDAGFEIRDQLAWMFGSGFPKSHNLDGDRKGWGTALKPAFEPICFARKPLIGTVAANVLVHGTGALNIDGCRVGSETRTNASAARADRSGFIDGFVGGTQSQSHDHGRWPANLIHDGSDEVLAAFPQSAGQQGVAKNDGELTGNAVYGAMRNVTTNPSPRGDSGSAARFFFNASWEDQEWLEAQFPALIAAAPLCLSRLADAIAQSDVATLALPEGSRLSVWKAPTTPVTPKQSRLLATALIEAIPNIVSESLHGLPHEERTQSPSRASVVARRTPTGTMLITASHSKSDGSADSITFSITSSSSEAGAKDCARSPVSRFTYCAKASKADREVGCAGLPTKRGGMVSNTSGQHITRRDGGEPGERANHHPTVKPTDLMRWLVRLVTPPGGTVLDPFMGSGSTGRAAVLEGFGFIGCDIDPEYVAIAHRRIFAAETGREAA